MKRCRHIYLMTLLVAHVGSIVTTCEGQVLSRPTVGIKVDASSLPTHFKPFLRAIKENVETLSVEVLKINFPLFNWQQDHKQSGLTQFVLIRLGDHPLRINQSIMTVGYVVGNNEVQLDIEEALYDANDRLPVEPVDDVVKRGRYILNKVAGRPNWQKFVGEVRIATRLELAVPAGRVDEYLVIPMNADELQAADNSVFVADIYDKNNRLDRIRMSPHGPAPAAAQSGWQEFSVTELNARPFDPARWNLDIVPTVNGMKRVDVRVQHYVRGPLSRTFSSP